MSAHSHKNRLIHLAAGGTGGHVMPALCVAETLTQQGHSVLMVTDKRGRKLIPADIPVKVIASASPFVGSPGQRLLALLTLALGLLDIGLFMLIRRPALVVGFGGYPAASPMIAGWALQIPVLMHEQNAILGRANLLLSRFTKRVLTSWPHTLNLPKINYICTGLPIRAGFSAIKPYRAEAKKSNFHLAIFGGSLGASLFGKNIPQAIALLPSALKDRLHVTHQVRDEQKQALEQFYQAQNIKADIAPFFDDVAAIMERADLLISRAGASSVAEIAGAGRAAILIPFAGALDDHQTKNANQLCQHQAALSLSEPEAQPEALATLIEEMMTDKSLRQKIAKNAHHLSRPDASMQICHQINHYAEISIKEEAA